MAMVEKENWIERLKSSGEVREGAITELRSILVRGLTATCRSRYGSKIQAEDVVQDALIKILDKLDTFEGRSKFTTWAMTIGVRIAISEMRRKHFNDVSMDHLLSNSMQFEPVAEPTPADNEDEKSNMLAKMTELIETDLTTKQRNAMHSLLNGMPVEVFAEKMGSNRNAVYKLVHDARVKLRQGFEQAGYKAEDFNSVFA
jgi:RNA polymerase sigma-70 factor (ECF subfamily)